MPRLEFSAQTKRDAFARSNGICECHRIPWLRRPNGCRVKLSGGNIFYEHINPDGIRKDASLDNCAVLSKTCWRKKTDRYDRKVIAKSNHVRDRFIGAFRSRSPLPGGRDDPRKKTMAGAVVDRVTGEPWRARR